MAHSHGGNVVKVASQSIKHIIDNLVNLGTPQNVDLSLLGYSTNTSAVKNYCNVYSYADPIQFAGASPLQIVLTGYFTYYGGYFAEQAALAFWQGDWYLGIYFSIYSKIYFDLANAFYLSTKVDWVANNVEVSGSHTDLHTVGAWKDNNIRGRCGL